MTFTQLNILLLIILINRHSSLPEFAVSPSSFSIALETRSFSNELHSIHRFQAPVMICQLRKTCARSYDSTTAEHRPSVSTANFRCCKHGNRSFPRFNAIRVFSVEKAQKRIPFTHSRAHWCTLKKEFLD